MDVSDLWIPATLAAAAAQTARNAAQRGLTERIGTVGATQVRFLYGLPFALVFLGLMPALTGEAIPAPRPAFFGYIALGSVAQILATAGMLAAMRGRSFAVVTAIIKTEPVLVALFGIALLGDTVTLPAAMAILVATAGVVILSVKTGAGLSRAGLAPVLYGIAAGGLFALAAIGFRGAILSLDDGSFLTRATTTLAWGLAVQTSILMVYLVLLDREALLASARVWRLSLGAGFLGALASQFWFIGFALTSAANVRTLALVEVLMAQAVAHRLFRQGTTGREGAGLILVVAGVGLLLAAQM
jgi:drug/metabolite transporter (DMT)-like permease